MFNRNGCGNHSENRKQSFLARLRDNTSGNTLAIVGAALIPLTAMIGSGVDMSRAYMAKTRLQSACDSAALAGRRVLVNDTLDDNAIAEARRYFNFNFPQGIYQTAAFTPTVTRPATGTFRVAASTTIPTAVMRIFGFTTLPLSVTCDASMNFVNTDIVLVLDVTRSMFCTPAESGLCGRTSEIPESRIVALRDAVTALYEELEPMQTQLESQGLRLRIAVVPFASTVNVGHLIADVNPAWIRNDNEYQTRLGIYNTPTYVGSLGTPEAPVQQIFNSGAGITQARCDLYGQNVSFGSGLFTASPTTGGGPAPAATWQRSFSNNEAAGTDWGWTGAADNNSSTDGTRSCRRYYVETDTTYETRYRYTSERWEPENINTASLKTRGATMSRVTNNGGTVPTNTPRDPFEVAADANNVNASTNITTTPVSWAGCIEERETVPTITSSQTSLTVPSGANDLNINLVPTNDNERWRMFLPQLTWLRPAGNASTTTSGNVTWRGTAGDVFAACPVEAKRLQAWTADTLDTYIASLVPDGATYHDIGMIWGARFISPSGIFADSPGTFNNSQVSRHIIYMTDGQLMTYEEAYSAYGIEQNQGRITGVTNATDTERNGRHTKRFQMACQAARQNGASIWLVAFATATDASMSSCASNPNQFFAASNRDQLVARFREIGSNIGALRLTQ